MNVFKLWTLALLIAAGIPNLSHAAVYTVDAAHSSVAFKIKHLSVSTVRGVFNEFTGEIKWEGAEALQAAAFTGEVEMASVDTNKKLRDLHLKGGDFFDVKNFPVMTFKSKSVRKDKSGQVILKGDFTLKGITKEIEIPVTISGPIKKGFQSIIGVEGIFKINRQEYGISWNNKIENSTYVLGDEVTIELNIEAVN